MKIGIILLAIFLLLYGLCTITNVQFEMQNFLLGASALAAAIFLALGR